MRRRLMHWLYQIYQFCLSLRQPVTMGVAALIVNEKKEVLLVRHTYVSGWHLPGGKVERGESLPVAAAREVQEELGIQALTPPRFWGLYYHPRKWRSDHIAIFVIDSWTQKTHSNFEIETFQFFATDHLPHDLSKGSRQRVQEWEQNPEATPSCGQWV